MSRLALLALSLTVAACSSPRAAQPDGDRRLWEYETSARSAFREGRFEAAMTRYELASRRAAEVDDGHALVRTLYERSATAMRLGAWDEAASLAAEAAREDARIGGERAAGIATLRAEIALRDGEGADALLLADGAGEGGEAARVRAEAHAMLGAPDESAAWLSRAEATGASGVGMARVRGRLALQQGLERDAAGWFDREAALAADAGDPFATAAALERSAEALELAGDEAGAAERWLRRGRSLAGQGRASAARDSLVRAEQLAVRAGAADVAASARFWMSRTGTGTGTGGGG